MRRADADARPVANLVGLVEHVDHVEAHGQVGESRDMEQVRDTEVERIVRGQTSAVRRAVDIAAQAAFVQQIGIDRRVPKRIGRAKGSAVGLVVVEVNIVVVDVVEIVPAELVLVRDDVLAERLADREVRVGVEGVLRIDDPLELVIARELDAVDLPVLVVERLQDDRRAELPVVELVLRLLVIGVEAGRKRARAEVVPLVRHAHVEVVGALGPHRIPQEHLRLVGRADEFVDVHRRVLFLRRRRKVTRIARVQRRIGRGLPDDIEARAQLVLVIIRVDHVKASAEIEGERRDRFPFILRIEAVLGAEAIAAVLHIHRRRAGLARAVAGKDVVVLVALRRLDIEQETEAERVLVAEDPARVALRAVGEEALVDAAGHAVEDEVAGFIGTEQHAAVALERRELEAEIARGFLVRLDRVVILLILVFVQVGGRERRRTRQRETRGLSRIIRNLKLRLFAAEHDREPARLIDDVIHVAEAAVTLRVVVDRVGAVDRVLDALGRSR